MGQLEIGHFEVEEPQQDVWGRGEGNVKSIDNDDRKPKNRMDARLDQGSQPTRVNTVGASMRRPKTT